MHHLDRLEAAQESARQDLTNRLEAQLVEALPADDPTRQDARALLNEISAALSGARAYTAQAQTQATETPKTQAATREPRAHIAPHSRAPRVALLRVWGDDLSAVEAARVSTGHHAPDLEELARGLWQDTPPPSPVDLTANTPRQLSETETARADKLRRYLWQHRHTSPFEHAGATFALSVPIYIARQIMRHRTLSVNEISRRYTAEGLEIWTPAPEDMRPQHKSALQCSREGEQIERAEELAHKIEAHMSASAELYEELLSAGLAREVARAVLPCATFTRFYLTGNLLNLLKMITLRLDTHAQPEARAVAADMLDALSSHFPKTCTLIITPREEPAT